MPGSNEGDIALGDREREGPIILDSFADRVQRPTPDRRHGLLWERNRWTRPVTIRFWASGLSAATIAKMTAQRSIDACGAPFEECASIRLVTILFIEPAADFAWRSTAAHIGAVLFPRIRQIFVGRLYANQSRSPGPDGSTDGIRGIRAYPPASREP